MAVKFTDNSQSAKDGLLNIQYTAMREAGSDLLTKIRDHIKAQDRTDYKSKQNYTNTAVRTYTRRKYGFVVAHIGLKNAEKAKGDPAATARYDLGEQMGTSQRSGNPYLSNITRANVQSFRDIIAKHLPGIQNSTDTSEKDEEIT